MEYFIGIACTLRHTTHILPVILPLLVIDIFPATGFWNICSSGKFSHLSNEVRRGIMWMHWMSLGGIRWETFSQTDSMSHQNLSLGPAGPKVTSVSHEKRFHTLNDFKSVFFRLTSVFITTNVFHCFSSNRILWQTSLELTCVGVQVKVSRTCGWSLPLDSERFQHPIEARFVALVVFSRGVCVFANVANNTAVCNYRWQV